MELKSVIGKKIAVSCETMDEVMELKEYMISLYPLIEKYPFEGNFERNMKKYGDVAFEFRYSEASMYGGISAGYCYCNWFKLCGYQVISIKDFIKMQEPNIEISFDDL